MSEHRVHHSHPGLTSLIVKVVIFTVASALITSVVVTSLLNLDTNSTRSYSAEFVDSSGLEPGDTVRISGVQVGKIDGISLADHQHYAKVSFSVDTSQHLTDHTLAVIHFENLLGQRFLSLQPGAPGGSPLKSGSTIPVSQTVSGLDLTAVFDGFQPLFQALQPAQVNQLAASIITVFQGESGTVAGLVQETAVITQNLAGRQQVIDSLLTSLSSLLNTVGVHDTQLGQLISSFDTLVQGLAASKTQLGPAITNLQGLTQTVSGLLSQSQPTLNQDIDGLATAAGTLATHQANIDSLLTGLPGLLNTVTKIQSTGNWINAYVCDLTVNIQGPPLNISLIPGVNPPVYPSNIQLPSGVVGDPSAPSASCA